MKILYAVLLVMICVGNVFGQKEQNIWLNGLYAGIDFNSTSPVTFRRPYPDDIWRTTASICDSNGNLLFFTNGFRVFNRNYDIMQNGNNLNLGDYFSYGYNELPVPDGAVIIPYPGQIGKYYLIHTDLNFISDSYLGNPLLMNDLYYDVIDMHRDGGLGGIVPDQKEVLFFTDTLANTGIQAIKHANGQDWWIFCHEYNSDRYYRFLIDKNGIHGPFTQNIGQAYSEYNAAVVNGDIRFNQQGTQMIKNNSDSCLFELYDFDRCTGELSNHRQIKVSDTLYQLWGLCFSPSGRFAYISANYETELFQFDLWAANIEKSKKLIAVYDETLNPLETIFYKMAIGPDGKIYMCNYDTNLSLHVINSPDSAGKSCAFVQNQLEFPETTYWGGGMPNLPNYHLDSLAGCDTVITNSASISQILFSHEVYPNPCTGKFQLSITGVNSKTEVVIYNEMGEVIEQATLQPVNGFIHGFFNLQNEPAGVYLAEGSHTIVEIFP